MIRASRSPTATVVSSSTSRPSLFSVTTPPRTRSVPPERGARTLDRDHDVADTELTGHHAVVLLGVDAQRLAVEPAGSEPPDLHVVALRDRGRAGRRRVSPTPSLRWDPTVAVVSRPFRRRCSAPSRRLGSRRCTAIVPPPPPSFHAVYSRVVPSGDHVTRYGIPLHRPVVRPIRLVGLRWLDDRLARHRQRSRGRPRVFRAPEQQMRW